LILEASQLGTTDLGLAISGAGDTWQGATQDLQTERLKDIIFHLPLQKIFDNRNLLINS